ncbi:SpoIIE family protein phosphatase [Streptomyces sp. AM 2-1-1]|uniref:ATP-binding SpoIIE family protein phosphatase n=1 Tax=Streptomyces sp. AM 2-1-1 TaxID=3028709 RepID=UPI0023B8BF02|nr:SpoIIE family protein phosphatase [Streptomyces sp. AM 2-1-1]WEH43101.1 SpoIIE family protein phosphatase [Streptomyces sp. AM 2-1-1]
MDASIDEAAVLNALFADSPQGLFLFDADHRVTRYNPSGRGVRELSAEEVIGHEIGDFAPGFDADTAAALIDEAFATGEPLRRRLVRGRSPSAPYGTLALEISLFPLSGSAKGAKRLVVGLVEDVTERQAAADRLAVLSSVHAALGSTLETRTIADGLVRSLVPAFADAVSVDLLDDGGDVAGPAVPPPHDAPLRRVSFAPAGAARSRKDGDSRPFPFATPYTQALGDARARLVRVSQDTPWLSAAPEDLAPLITAGVHSMIVAPLVVRETVLGLLTLYRRRPDPFEEADLDVARQAASTASAHFDNARRYHRESTIATTLHRRLQPGTIPELTAVETAHVYLPETAGGDWFDVIPLSGARVALVVGDVVGHGIEAAATMGQLRIAVRTLALQDLEPDELLTHLDEVCAQLVDTAARSGSEEVATCALTVYDPVSRRCTMIRAGHPAPLVIDPNGTRRTVDVPEGPPLGAGGGRAYFAAETELLPGSLLAHFTHGLLDAGGHDRTTAARGLADVLASSTRPLAELCDTAVYRMAPSRHDDAVLLLARTRVLPPDRVADWTLPADASVVGTARRLVERQLAAWDLDDAAYATELVVSELVTNAIRYGTGPVRLRLIHDRGRLLSEVTDANSASPHLRHARESDEGGRGLYIVMRFSNRWGVRHGRRDKTIWCEQRLDGPSTDAPAEDAFDLDAVPEL